MKTEDNEQDGDTKEQHVTTDNVTEKRNEVRWNEEKGTVQL